MMYCCVVCGAELPGNYAFCGYPRMNRYFEGIGVSPDSEADYARRARVVERILKEGLNRVRKSSVRAGHDHPRRWTRLQRAMRWTKCWRLCRKHSRSRYDLS